MLFKCILVRNESQKVCQLYTLPANGFIVSFGNLVVTLAASFDAVLEALFTIADEAVNNSLSSALLF